MGQAQGRGEGSISKAGMAGVPGLGDERAAALLTTLGSSLALVLLPVAADWCPVFIL